MANTNRIVKVFKDENDGLIVSSDLPSGQSPAALIDLDETLSWIKGTYIGNGEWAFDVPSGYPRGFKWGVYVAEDNYIEDSGLNGGSFGAGEHGFFYSPGAEDI